MQRPSTSFYKKSDKTAIGNATIFRTGRLKRIDDRKMIAKELDVPLTDLTGMKPLDFVERSNVTGVVKRGGFDYIQILKDNCSTIQQFNNSII